MSTIPFHKNLSPVELAEEVTFHRLKSSNDYDTSVPHRHGYYELFFFEQGSGSHLIDYQRVDIQNRSVHVVCPGQVHQLQLASVAKGCFLTFSESFLIKHLSLQQLHRFSFLQAYQKPAILQTGKSEFQQYLDFCLSVEQAEENGLACAWLNLLLQKLKLAFEAKSDFYRQSSKDLELVQFKTLLEQYFTAEHLPRFYAKKMGVSEKSLNLRIKSVHHITATEIIVNRIVLEAKRLLLNSKLSIKEISYDLGFSDPAYFSRFIKKHTTKSPKELRDSI